MRNRKYLYILHGILFAVFCALVFIPEFFQDGKTKDYPRWFWVGSQFLNGGNLYDGFNFLYPPFAALLMSLPVPLGKIVFYCVLLITSMAAWIIAVEISIKLLGDVDKLKPWHLILSVVLVLPFLVENFDLGQPNVILLTLMLWGLYALRRCRSVLGGISFGAAVAIKFFPITILPYLLWRRYWTASAVMLATALLLTFLAPAPFRGFERNAAEVRQWFDGMKGSEDGFGQRSAQNWSWKNQSLIGFTHRLVRHLDYRAVDKVVPPEYMNIVDVGYKTANFIILIIAAAIGLGFVLTIPAQANRTESSDNLEWSILFCLMTIASPLARNYYFIWLYFPIFTLIWHASVDHRPDIRKWLAYGIMAALAVGLLALPIFPLFLQAAGNYLAMTAIIIFMLVWLIRNQQSGKAAST